MSGGKFESHLEAAQNKVSDPDAPAAAPFDGAKAEAAQRLQVGLFGLGSMVLLIGLATIIGNQADATQERAVPDAAPTTEPVDAAPQRDPLADAGIVPDVPAEPDPQEVEGLVEDLPLEDVGQDQAGGPTADAFEE